jgi:uncharacterized protein YjhX (UPF0386 family)
MNDKLKISTTGQRNLFKLCTGGMSIELTVRQEVTIIACYETINHVSRTCKLK